MCFRKRLCGLCLLVFGVGMFIGVLLGGVALIIGAAVLVGGLWCLFM